MRNKLITVELNTKLEKTVNKPAIPAKRDETRRDETRVKKAAKNTYLNKIEAKEDANK